MTRRTADAGDGDDPHAERPASLTPTQIATLLDASCRAIILEVEALAPRGDYRPIPGTWCPNEVVGHLIEADQHGFAWRIRSMLAEENPILRTWVPSAVAAARHDDGRDAFELAAEFGTLRDGWLTLVRSLGPAALARPGRHPRVGELTVRDLLHEWVHHDREHLAQLAALTQRLVWPGMGNARRFSEPDAQVARRTPDAPGRGAIGVRRRRGLA
jgi:hypothetical protein